LRRLQRHIYEEVEKVDNVLLENLPAAAVVRAALARLDAERRLLLRLLALAQARESAEAAPERRAEGRRRAAA
jgi:hypothetical protein